MRLGKTIKIVALVAIAVVVAAMAIVARMDLNEYKPLLVEKVAAATGRSLSIAGDIHFAPSLVPSLVVEGIAFQNAAFGTRDEMIKARRLEAAVALLPLLRGQIEIRRLALIGPDILLETDVAGRGNWEFAPSVAETSPQATPGGDPLDLPYLATLVVEDGLVTYRDGATGRTVKLEVVRFAAGSSGRDEPLALDVAGAYDGTPFTVGGRVGALSALDAPRAFPLDLTVGIGGGEIILKGGVVRPLAPSAANLALSVSGVDLNGWATLTKMALPAKPYSLAGNLSLKGRKLELTGLQANLGGSDLAGTLSLDLAEARPRFSAALSAARFDLADIRPATTETSGSPPVAASDGGLFSDAPFDLSPLDRADGRLELRIGSLLLGGPQASDVTATFGLENGRLQLQPFAARLAGGSFAGHAGVAARDGAAADLSLSLKAEKLDLAQLARAFDAGDLIAGQGDLTVDLKGQGASLRALMGSLGGRASWVMGQGQVKSGYVDLLGADLLRFAASAGAGGGDSTAVNCFVARFDVTKGVASTQDILFDTDRMTVKGEGTIGLGSERLALLFTPRPKETSLINLAMPWRVQGTLQSPSVSVDETALAERAAGALLTAINPLALLVPMVMSGAGDQNPCLAALQSGSARPPGGPSNGTGGARGFLDSLIPGR